MEPDELAEWAMEELCKSLAEEVECKEEQEHLALAFAEMDARAAD